MGAVSGERGLTWKPGAARAQQDAALHNFVTRIMLQFMQHDGHLWSGLADHERQLRCVCLSKQFCRLAQDKLNAAVATGAEADTWGNYLRTPRGRERMETWVKKMIYEHAAKRQV